MQGKNKSVYIFNRIFYYLMALGTFLLGTIIDLAILIIFDTYTPIFGLSAMLYNVYNVFKEKLTQFSPPKKSIHLLVDKVELETVYEMFAELAPKGSNLRIFRSIGLENPAEMSITKAESCLYIEEDMFLRCNQNENTRAYGFATLLNDVFTTKVISRPIEKISLMSKLSNLVGNYKTELGEDNKRTRNNMAKAAIVGGLVGGGSGALIGSSTIGATKTLQRSPFIAVLVLLLGFFVYLLALFLVMIIPILIIYYPLINRVKGIGQNSIGNSESEQKSNWQEGNKLYEHNDHFHIDAENDFYKADKGWEPLYTA